MPEVTIKYQKPETLKVLKGLAKYFDFKISGLKTKKKKVNGFTVTPGDPSIVPDDLSDIFSSRQVDAKTLREKAWKRGS